MPSCNASVIVALEYKVLSAFCIKCDFNHFSIPQGVATVWVDLAQIIEPPVKIYQNLVHL